MDDADYTTEVWKTIPFAPEYAASSFGRIKRAVDSRTGNYKAGRLLTPCEAQRGKKYLIVSLHIEGRQICQFVHLAVLITFRGPRPSPEMQCAHNDGNRANNRLENLRWATPKENSADKVIHGTVMNGAKNHMTIINPEKVRFIRNSPLSVRAAAKVLGISSATVQQVRSGRTWRGVI